ncbi:MAG: DUF6020 family protein [Lachnospiraceae bacterium]|nr:DUF6020 family protein [Lachnospiraceae bacterium]
MKAITNRKGGKLNRQYVKYLVASICFSLVFIVLLLIGNVIFDCDTMPSLATIKSYRKAFYSSPVLFAGIVALLFFLLVFLDKHTVGSRRLIPDALRKSFVPAVLLMVCYGIVFISYYPGTWCYDMIQQNRMIAGVEELTGHHPLLHTYLWGLCRWIEGITGGFAKGIAVYSILQIIAFSFALGRVVVCADKVLRNDFVTVLTLFFFLLNPTFALFSFSPTKDVWCTVFFVLALSFICEGKRIPYVVITLLLACMFRNNMIYALVPVAVILFITVAGDRKRIVITSVSVLAGLMLTNAFFFGVLGIPKSDAKEMLSVPIQQIGRAYSEHGDSFTAEERELVDRYIGLDIVGKYNPRISDPLKTTFNNDGFKRDKAGFIRLWAGLGVKYPGTYVTAYLSQYSPYWYVRAKSYEPYTSSPYVEDFIFEDPYYSFERAGLLDPVYNLFHRIAQGSSFILFSRGLPFWICLTALFMSILLKRKTGTAIALVCLFYMLTLFLGPICLARYTLPVLAAAPLMALSVIKRNHNGTEDT